MFYNFAPDAVYTFFLSICLLSFPLLKVLPLASISIFSIYRSIVLHFSSLLFIFSSNLIYFHLSPISLSCLYIYLSIFYPFYPPFLSAFYQILPHSIFFSIFFISLFMYFLFFLSIYLLSFLPSLYFVQRRIQAPCETLPATPSASQPPTMQGAKQKYICLPFFRETSVLNQERSPFFPFF